MDVSDTPTFWVWSDSRNKECKGFHTSVVPMVAEHFYIESTSLHWERMYCIRIPYQDKLLCSIECVLSLGNTGGKHGIMCCKTTTTNNTTEIITTTIAK